MMPQEFLLQPSPKRYIKSADDVAIRGEWVPVFTFAVPGDLSVSYSQQNGNYVRILNAVIVQFWVDLATFTHTTASGGARITGLPFAALAQDTPAIRAVGNCWWSGITEAGYSQVTPSIVPGNSHISFVMSGSGQTESQLLAASMPTGGTPVFVGSITYFAE